MNGTAPTKLGDVVEFCYGRALPKGQRVSGSIPVYGSNGVTGWHDEFLVSSPTVIVGRKGSAGAVHLTDSPCYPIDTTYYVRPRCPNALENRYIFYLLQRLKLGRLATATGVPGLNREDAYALDVVIPQLDEQRRIVDILDRAASIRRLRQQAQNTARLIIPALFNKMFGDPATNPMGWPIATLGELGSLERGRSRHRPRNDPALLGGPYPLIQTGEVAAADWYINSFKSTYSELGLQQSRLWPSGTLCITIAANIANSGILTFDACFPDSVVAFTPGVRVTTIYAKACLDFLREGIERLAPQLAQKNINLDILQQVPFPVPPLALQAEFGNRVKAVTQMAERQREGESSAENMLQSIQSRMFG